MRELYDTAVKSKKTKKNKNQQQLIPITKLTWLPQKTSNGIEAPLITFKKTI